jgi:putative endonuclease
VPRFYVYIMASRSRVLYIGITNDIRRRVWEHRHNVFPGFTSKYRIHRLVYYETFKYVGNVINREKQLKGWLRLKKLALISSENPTREDLGEQWFDGENVRRIHFEPAVEKTQVLRSAQDDKPKSAT